MIKIEVSRASIPGELRVSQRPVAGAKWNSYTMEWVVEIESLDAFLRQEGRCIVVISRVPGVLYEVTIYDDYVE